MRKRVGACGGIGLSPNPSSLTPGLSQQQSLLPGFFFGPALLILGFSFQFFGFTPLFSGKPFLLFFRQNGFGHLFLRHRLFGRFNILR